MKIQNATLNDVLGVRARKSAAFAQTFANDEGVLFNDVTGFHIYGHLGLHLRLAAAEEAKNADTYLDLLEEYAQIAEACSGRVGAALLEVQGERLHFLLPAAALDNASIKQLLQFCIALTGTVYDTLKPKAGEDWDGFALAADHGRVIVIATGREGDDSVVSLGNAANRPAKRLARTPAVKAGYLALASAVFGKSPLLISGGAFRADQAWIEINVKEPAGYLAPVINVPLQNQMNESATAIANAFRERRNLVTFATANDIAAHATIDDPVEVQAICVRADLDGFSRQVEAAFAAGTEQAIRSLIQRFLVIMDFPEEFGKRLNRTVISLPWAGDCATQIIPLNRGEIWATLRKTMPAVAAITWHDCDGEDDGRIQEIRTAMEGTRWAIGVAGGDEDEGSSGRMLIANIRTAARKYRVASGWNVRRSLDAQQADNVVADDTVVHITDYDGLNTNYQIAFKELRDSTIFRCAKLAALKRVRQNQIAAMSVQTSVTVPNIIAGAIPPSRPFGNE